MRNIACAAFDIKARLCYHANSDEKERVVREAGKQVITSRFSFKAEKAERQLA